MEWTAITRPIFAKLKDTERFTGNEHPCSLDKLRHIRKVSSTQLMKIRQGTKLGLGDQDHQKVNCGERAPVCPRDT